MQVRKATPSDLPEISKIFEIAREYMRQSGNPNQWGTDRPAKETYEQDILLGQFYVVEAEETGELLGVFAFIVGADPTYAVIYDGNWLNDLPYGTIHRIASSGKVKGIFDFVINWASTQGVDVRVDTHEQNLTMQHLLTKNGFTKCGTILLADGDPRLAYHKHIN